MSTQKQREANLRNAQFSSGPETPEDKAVFCPQRPSSMASVLTTPPSLQPRHPLPRPLPTPIPPPRAPGASPARFPHCAERTQFRPKSKQCNANSR